MDERSVTRPRPSPTRAFIADEAFCAQAAALLMCDQEPIRDAFLGEPAEEVLEMVRWAISHEDDEGFDPAAVLIAWAKKRERGAWSGRGSTNGTTRNGQHPEGDGPNGEGVSQESPDGDAEREAALRVARYWEAHPEKLAEALRWPHTDGRS